MCGQDPYYERRLREELVAAERAGCEKAAAVHRELAGIYRALVDSEDSRSRPKVVVLRPVEIHAR